MCKLLHVCTYLYKKHMRMLYIHRYISHLVFLIDPDMFLYAWWRLHVIPYLYELYFINNTCHRACPWLYKLCIWLTDTCSSLLFSGRVLCRFFFTRHLRDNGFGFGLMVFFWGNVIFLWVWPWSMEGEQDFEKRHLWVKKTTNKR